MSALFLIFMLVMVLSAAGIMIFVISEESIVRYIPLFALMIAAFVIYAVVSYVYLGRLVFAPLQKLTETMQDAMQEEMNSVKSQLSELKELIENFKTQNPDPKTHQAPCSREQRSGISENISTRDFVRSILK